MLDVRSGFSLYKRFNAVRRIQNAMQLRVFLLLFANCVEGIKVTKCTSGRASSPSKMKDTGSIPRNKKLAVDAKKNEKTALVSSIPASTRRGLSRSLGGACARLTRAGWGSRRAALVERFDIEPFSDFSAKWANFRGHVLFCIDAKFARKYWIFVGKFLTRSARFTCFCTAQTSIF